jgi:Holliday junction resolvase RusA-like endonuclease
MTSAENAGDFAPMKSEGQAPVAPSRPVAIYAACIPLNPRTKKNSQRIVMNSRTKAPMILPDPKYKEYEAQAGWFLKRKPEKPISQPVNVKCLFFRDSRRRCDLTNLLEAIDDILVKYGILADDNFEIIRGHDGSRVFVDKERPGTFIEITPLTE